MTPARRTPVRGIAIIPPHSALHVSSGTAAAWRAGCDATTEDAVLLCGAPLAVDEPLRQSLLSALQDHDAVVIAGRGGVAGVLVRRTELDRLVLLRNRARGGTAIRELLVRLHQSRPHVHMALVDMPTQLPERMSERMALAARRLVERLGWFGFVMGTFSRSHRPAEVWQFRRSTPAEDPTATCPLCGADADHQVRTPLHTTDDLTALGSYSAMLCTACRNAYTTPPPSAAERVITPDVGEQALTASQRTLMRRFIGERVRRVRALVPAPGARVLDVGGGACAFANALAASGCAVTVCEPNPANARFADTARGVRFLPVPFDERAVTDAALADGSFDAVTMWHSLEHVPNVMETLALARRLLRPGGVLYVCTPNLDALQADLGGNRWCYLDIPHHVTHFTPEGMADAFHRAGFVEPTPHWWNAEWEIFGFYQTLLNVLSGSHNYFYNRAKKGKHAAAGAHPGWTRAVTAAGPLLLPLAVLLSWWGAAASKPSCVEMHAVTPS